MIDNFYNGIVEQGIIDRTGKMIVEPQLSDLEIEEYIKTLKA